MDAPFLGMIAIFGFNFPPRGWALCNGQILSISQNPALFSLLGTYYGGDGQTNFQLPNLQGRVPIGMGNGTGLTPRTIGETGGAEAVALIVSQMPSHSHTLVAYADSGTTAIPTGALLANTGGLDPEYRTTAGPSGTTAMGSGAIAANGGSQPHPNMQPYLALNYSIALEGIFPSRN